MVNIENELFTLMKTALTTEYSDIYITGVDTPTMPSFPAVLFEEKDNSVYRNGIDNSDTENFANLMYEVNVYSNKKSGKKAEARKIIDSIDNFMYSKGFTRITLTPVPNINDATIYRYTARYTAVASNDKYIYRS